MFGFAFLSMAGSYDSRKVCRDEFPWGVISTVEVNDGLLDYETAVKHPEYNNGDWMIVEAYDTRELAELGHAKWKTIMTGELPDELTDCMNSDVSRSVSDEPFVYLRKR